MNATGVGILLLESALKATVMLAVALAAASALRRRSAAERHLVWTVAVVGALVLPLLIFATPAVRIPVLPVSIESSVERGAPVAGTTAMESETTRDAVAIVPVSRGTSAVAEQSSAGGWFHEWTLTTWLFAVWAAGALVLVTRYVLGVVAAARLVRSADPLDEPAWEDRVLEAVARLDLRAVPRVCVSPRTPVPLACGVLRPALVLPAEARTWAPGRADVVLLHELAHIRRRDCLVQAFVQVACALYWFHPLVWMAARRLRAERERACDDLVLATGTAGPDYAEHLLGIARAARHDVPAAAAALAMARVSELEGRLLAILDSSRSRSGLGRDGLRRLVAAAATLLLGLAVVEPVSRAAVLPDVAASPAHAGLWPSNQTAGQRAAESARASWGMGAGRAPGAGQTPSPTPTPTPTPTPSAGQGAQESAEVPESVVRGLTEALEDQDEDVREQALAALGRLRVPLAFDALVAAVGDDSPDIRAQAVHMLGEYRDARAVPTLIGALKDPSEDVRSNAVFALGQLRSREAIPALQAALADESEDVREQAAFALSQLRAREAVPDLTRALRDPSPDVREQAAFALSQIRDPSSVGPLVDALKDEKADVREKALFALSQIRDPAAVPGLIAALKDPTPDVREQAAFALSQLRDVRAVDPLIAALKDESADVRENVVFALAEIRDPRALEPITAALKDPSPDVREKAAWALSELAGRPGRNWKVDVDVAGDEPNPNPDPNPNPNPNPEG